MTESVWWYVLAGFLIGFVLSTLWEWLYFRRRRLRTENRRIAELEATVRSLTLASGSVGYPAAPVAPVTPPEYQGPGVFLENEGAPGMPESGLAPQPAFAVYSTTDKQRQPDAQSEQAPPPTVVKRTRSQYVEHTAPAAGEPVKTTEQQAPPTAIELTDSQYVERTAPAASEPVKTAEQTPPPPTVIERTSSQYVERTAPAAGEPVKATEQTPPPPAVIERTSSQYVERTAPSAGEPAKAAEQTPPTANELTDSQYVERTTPAAGEPVKTTEQTPAPSAVIERTSSQYVERTGPAAGEPVKTAEQAPPPPTVIERTSSQYVERTAPAASEPVKATEQTPPTVIEHTSTEYVERTAPTAGEPMTTAEQEQQQQPSQLESPVAPEPTHAQKAAPLPVVAGALAALSHLSKSPAADPQPQPAPATAQPDSAAAQLAPPVRPMPVQQNGFAHKSQEQEGAVDQTGIEADAGESESNEPLVTQGAAPGSQAEQPPGTLPGALPGAPAEQAADTATTLSAPEQPLPSAPSLRSFLPAAPKLADASGNGSHPGSALAPKALPSEGIGPGIERVSSELEDAMASLQGLIQTTNPLLDSTTADEAGHPDTAEPAVTGPFEARNLSRGEYTVVRLMQSARQFGRELRALYWRG